MTRQSEYTDSNLEVNYCPGAISGKISPKTLILHKHAQLTWLASFPFCEIALGIGGNAHMAT